MANLSQTEFSGGLNFVAAPNKIPDGQYRLGFNVRSRSGSLSGIKTSDVDATAPSGKKAAIVNFGSYLVLFSGGTAYYKASAASAWAAVQDWTGLNAAADRYFTVIVPAAELLFARKLVSATDASGTGFSSGVTVDPGALINGTIAGLLIQDGSNQPIIIYAEAGVLKARKTATYDEWTTTTREYVPIGKQMVYLNGILYIASIDGTKIYRSVSGRPLDFMVNITTAGDKPAIAEADGGADTVAYPIGFSPITAMFVQNENFILVCTESDESYAVIPNYETLIFGEPTFLRRYVLDTAAINQFSGVDILGDFAFIARGGVRSYNAVLQLQNEGKNSIFSQTVAGLIQGIQQTDASCVGSYDNYVFFSISTIFGFYVLVFDRLSQKFVSLDDIYSTAQIKQFATLDPASETPTFWCITDDNKVVQIFRGGDSGITYATASSVIRGASAVIPGVQLKTDAVRLLFELLPNTGTITLTVAGLVDNAVDAGMSATKTFTPPASVSTAVVGLPISLPSANTSRDDLINMPNTQQGNTIQLIVSFTGNCALTSVYLSLREFVNGNPLRSQ